MVFSYRRQNSLLRMAICSLLTVCLSFSLVVPPSYAQLLPNLPAPGQSVKLTAQFQPPVLKGMIVHPENPLLFDFIVDRGDDKLDNQPLKMESEKLIKYFLASMTIPDKDAWVNLSPYEKDRIIPDTLGSTEMGRQMLEQDYILKQLASSLTNPDTELGQKYWNEVRRRAQIQFGTTDLPYDSVSKVWIVPDGATVVEKDGFAYITESKLKVMLEEDYLALTHDTRDDGRWTTDEPIYHPSSIVHRNLDVNATSQLTTEVFRELILPELVKEVNTGKTFAPTRQVYQSVVLATWYKQALKDSLLVKVYADKAKVKGVETNDKEIKHKVYQQYLEAFKKGVYNLIKEDVEANGEVIPRKYFSGGQVFSDVPITRRKGEPAAEIMADGPSQLALAPTNMAETPAEVRAVGDAAAAQAPPTSIGVSQPRDSYQDFYKLFGAMDNPDGSGPTITEERVNAFSLKFLTPDSQMLPPEQRRLNETWGVENEPYGITEVYFVPPGQTRDRMMEFQAKLKQFGDKVYLVDGDRLHFTTQGLEQQWDDQKQGTKKPLALHSGLDTIDLGTGNVLAVRQKARSIETPALKMQVAGLNYNPQTGIFWELRPYLADPASDPIKERRKAWGLPEPRPPHITAAYFTQPFTAAQETQLRNLLNEYSDVTHFGDIQVDNVQVIAYTNFAFNASEYDQGYVVLETVALTAPAAALVDVQAFLDGANSFVSNRILPNRNIEYLTQDELNDRLLPNGIAYNPSGGKNHVSDISVVALLDGNAHELVGPISEGLNVLDGVRFKGIKPADSHVTLFGLRTAEEFKLGDGAFRAATQEEMLQEYGRLNQAEIFPANEVVEFQISGIHLFNDGVIVAELSPPERMAYVQSAARKVVSPELANRPFFYITMGFLQKGTTTAGIQAVLAKLAEATEQLKGIKVRSADILVSNNINYSPQGLRESLFIKSSSAQQPAGVKEEVGDVLSLKGPVVDAPAEMGVAAPVYQGNPTGQEGASKDSAGAAKMKRRNFLSLGIVIAAGFLGYGYSKPSSAQSHKPSAQARENARNYIKDVLEDNISLILSNDYDSWIGALRVNPSDSTKVKKAKEKYVQLVTNERSLDEFFGAFVQAMRQAIGISGQKAANDFVNLELAAILLADNLDEKRELFLKYSLSRYIGNSVNARRKLNFREWQKKNLDELLLLARQGDTVLATQLGVLFDSAEVLIRTLGGDSQESKRYNNALRGINDYLRKYNLYLDVNLNVNFGDNLHHVYIKSYRIEGYREVWIDATKVRVGLLKGIDNIVSTTTQGHTSMLDGLAFVLLDSIQLTASEVAGRQSLSGDIPAAIREVVRSLYDKEFKGLSEKRIFEKLMNMIIHHEARHHQDFKAGLTLAEHQVEARAFAQELVSGGAPYYTLALLGKFLGRGHDYDAAARQVFQSLVTEAKQSLPKDQIPSELQNLSPAEFSRFNPQIWAQILTGLSKLDPNTLSKLAGVYLRTTQKRAESQSPVLVAAVIGNLNENPDAPQPAGAARNLTTSRAPLSVNDILPAGFDPDGNVKISGLVMDLDSTAALNSKTPLQGENLRILMRALIEGKFVRIITGSPYDDETEGSLGPADTSAVAVRRRVADVIKSELAKMGQSGKIEKLVIRYISGRGRVTFDARGNETILEPKESRMDTATELEIARGFASAFVQLYFSGQDESEARAEARSGQLRAAVSLTDLQMVFQGFFEGLGLKRPPSFGAWGSELVLDIWPEEWHGQQRGPPEGQQVLALAKEIWQQNGVRLPDDKYFMFSGHEYAKVTLGTKANVIAQELAELAPEGMVVALGDSSNDDFLTGLDARSLGFPYLPVYLGKASDVKGSAVYVVLDPSGQDNVKSTGFAPILSAVREAEDEEISYRVLIQRLNREPSAEARANFPSGAAEQGEGETVAGADNGELQADVLASMRVTGEFWQQIKNEHGLRNARIFEALLRPIRNPSIQARIKWSLRSLQLTDSALTNFFVLAYLAEAGQLPENVLFNSIFVLGEMWARGLTSLFHNPAVLQKDGFETMLREIDYMSQIYHSSRRILDPNYNLQANVLVYTDLHQKEPVAQLDFLGSIFRPESGKSVPAVFEFQRDSGILRSDHDPVEWLRNQVEEHLSKIAFEGLVVIGKRNLVRQAKNFYRGQPVTDDRLSRFDGEERLEDIVFGYSDEIDHLIPEASKEELKKYFRSKYHFYVHFAPLSDRKVQYLSEQFNLTEQETDQLLQRIGKVIADTDGEVTELKRGWRNKYNVSQDFMDRLLAFGGDADDIVASLEKVEEIRKMHYELFQIQQFLLKKYSISQDDPLLRGRRLSGNDVKRRAALEKKGLVAAENVFMTIYDVFTVRGKERDPKTADEILELYVENFEREIISQLATAGKDVSQYVSEFERSQRDSAQDPFWRLKELRAAIIAQQSEAGQEQVNPGGIDFDPSKLDLQIKRDGRGVPLPIGEQNLDAINIEGLYPVIINILPINAQTLPILSQWDPPIEASLAKI